MLDVHYLKESDAAENSIMQTITIAVSAILIAAGLVTAPGLINNARDNNTTGDLANIAYAQEFALGEQGHYYAEVDPNVEGSLGDVEGIKYTISGTSKNLGALICADEDAYLLYGTSSSGRTFFRHSASSSTFSTKASMASTIPACIVALPEYAALPESAGGTTPPVTADPNASGINWASSSTGFGAFAASNDGSTIVSHNPSTGKLSKSVDGGATWVELPGYSAISSSALIDVFISGNTIIAVNSPEAPALQTALKVSKDGGTTWVAGTGGSNFVVNSVAIHSNGLTTYASNTTTFGTSVKKLSKSSNGTSFLQGSGTAADYFADIALSGDDSTLVGAAVNGILWKTTDGGTTWTQLTNSGTAQWKSVSVSTNGSRIAAAQNNGVFVSSDGGATWNHAASTESGNWVSVDSSGDGSKIVAASASGTVITSSDGGATWKTQPSTVKGQRVSVNSAGTKLFITDTTSGKSYAADWS